MSNSLVKLLYMLSRTSGKIATALTDAEVVISGDPKKIAKRLQKKVVNKVSNEVRKDINKRIK